MVHHPKALKPFWKCGIITAPGPNKTNTTRSCEISLCGALLQAWRSVAPITPTPTLVSPYRGFEVVCPGAVGVCNQGEGSEPYERVWNGAGNLRCEGARLKVV